VGNARSPPRSRAAAAIARPIGCSVAASTEAASRSSSAASTPAAGCTLASVIANEFAEASDPLYLSALMALALVRFGLRAADDPRIRNTVQVIDAADEL